jgi:hypothetical protein
MAIVGGEEGGVWRGRCARMMTVDEEAAVGGEAMGSEAIMFSRRQEEFTQNSES